MTINSSISKRCSYSKEMLGFCMTKLIISNKEMNDIIKKVNSLESSGLLIKGVNETIQNEAKQQKSGIS